MANETAQVADYAVALRYDDIPGDVVERAKQAIADTIASIVYGHQLPWSRIIAALAERTGAGGRSRVLGPGGALVHAGAAALANGALAHAFEMDNLTWPSTGVHPGATLLSAGLAVAQERGIGERGSGGRELITAFVAGAEVMIRIGRATKHSNEIRGFHAPGTTGPFGAAIACGRLMHFDAERMKNALGVAGSLACGLLEFARSGTGAMVKRLHLGRAAESGVLAASLAGDGYHRPVYRARRRGRVPARVLRRVRHGRADARSGPATMRPARSCSSAFPATSPRTPPCKPSASCGKRTDFPAPTWRRSRSPATIGWRRSTASRRPPTS